MEHRYNTHDYKAVILAGGTGIRLQPLTLSVPKPVLRLGKYFIEYTLDNFVNAGFYDTNIAVQHMGEEIVERINDGSEFAYAKPLKVKYLKAQRPDEFKGTADVLRKARHHLADGVRVVDKEMQRELEITPEEYMKNGDKYEFKHYVEHFKHLIIGSGDIITNFDLSELVEFHEKRSGLGTVALFRIDDKKKIVGNFGIAKIDRHGKVTKFDEKADHVSKVYSNDTNASFYIFDREILDLIEKNDDLLDFGRDVLPYLTKDHKLFGLRMHGIGPYREPYWNDVGKFDNYRSTAKHMIEEHISGVNPLSHSIKTQRFFPIKNGAKHRSIVGLDFPNNSRAHIDGCIIGNDTIIGEESNFTDCIIYTNCKLENSGRGLIIGSNVTIEKGAEIGDYVVIGNGVTVKSSADIHAGVKIAPQNVVKGKVEKDIKESGLMS